jgi:hypothetical protein
MSEKESPQLLTRQHNKNLFLRFIMNKISTQQEASDRNFIAELTFNKKVYSLAEADSQMP